MNTTTYKGFIVTKDLMYPKYVWAVMFRNGAVMTRQTTFKNAKQFINHIVA
jgi:hypothetical protein